MSEWSRFKLQIISLWHRASPQEKQVILGVTAFVVGCCAGFLGLFK